MTELIETLYKWQTLIGSTLGGIFALLAALVVASVVRRREEVASGMLVIANLIKVRTTSEALDHIAKDEGVPDADYSGWFSDKLVSLHPSLSVLFESSLARIMPVNMCMAAHLSLFHEIYSRIEIILKRLSRDFEHFHEYGKPLRPPEHLRADADIVTRHFQQAVRHASCAENLISKLILSRISTWHKLKRHIWINREEKECLRILKEGNI